jgi:hypothetical protein
MTSQPLLADGVEFKMGMTIYGQAGYSHHTKEGQHRLLLIEDRWSLSASDGLVTTDLAFFFSSPSAVADWNIKRLQNSIANEVAAWEDYKLNPPPE